MSIRFLNNVTVNDEYTLPSADGTANQIITTDGAGQLSFVDQSTLNSGSAERTEILVKNVHGSALSKGDPVYIVGSVGASDRLEVALANASNSAKMPCVGLLTQDLANNGEGTATVNGKLKNLITSPIDGATPTENDTIYVKPGGGLTLTKPTGSTNLIQNVGQVGRVSTSSDGNIVVSAILRSNDVPNLPTGRIWIGDGNTIASNTVYVDEPNNRVGINTSSPKQLLHLMKGGITASFTAPDSEVLRVQSKAPSELSGNPPASDINIFTDGTGGGYSRIIFTDDTVTYGENGLYYDHANRYFSIVNKGATVATATSTKSFYCGENHTIGTNDYAFAANDGNTPSGQRSFAAGHLTEATGDISAAFGYDTLASGGASFSIGALTTASGGNSFASGGGSTASGGESAAFGFETTASGEESFAIGNQTTASGASSFAGGGPTTLAGAPNAFAFGADVDITGGHSAGFGRLHDIAGTENLVGGFEHTVNGAANLVGGATNDLASNEGMVVGGGNNTCPGSANWSLLVGQNNQASGANWSFTGGKESQNFSEFGIAYGSGATASNGDNQFAFGEGTVTPTNATSALSSNQFTVGKFNDFGYDCLFSVGNGTSTSSRSNALIVRQSGTVGIGTNTPNYKLHVAGGSNAGVWVERTTSGSQGSLSLLAGNTANVIQSKGLTNATKQLNFIVGVGTVMSIATSGNVGIGDQSPSEKLEVNGTVKATATTDAYKGYLKQTVATIAVEKLESTNYYYIPYNSTSTAATAEYYNRMTAAYDGRIKKVYLRHSGGSTPTATGVNFKKEINGTLSGTVYAATVANSATTSMTAYRDFGNSDFTFSAGDLIGILYQTTDAFGTASKTMGGIAITIIIEYNIT